MGGGFPVGAVGGKREFMAVFDPTAGKPALPHGGTFSANPVTMRAGIAAMELLDDAAKALRLPDAETLRARLLERAARLELLWSAGSWQSPVTAASI